MAALGQIFITLHYFSVQTTYVSHSLTATSVSLTAQLALMKDIYILQKTRLHSEWELQGFRPPTQTHGGALAGLIRLVSTSIANYTSLSCISDSKCNLLCITNQIADWLLDIHMSVSCCMRERATLCHKVRISTQGMDFLTLWSRYLCHIRQHTTFCHMTNDLIIKTKTYHSVVSSTTTYSMSQPKTI